MKHSDTLAITTLLSAGFAGRRNSSTLLKTFGSTQQSRGISESETLEKGLKEKSAEFVEKGSALYVP